MGQQEPMNLIKPSARPNTQFITNYSSKNLLAYHYKGVFGFGLEGVKC
jgi:hypothetical protein